MKDMTRPGPKPALDMLDYLPENDAQRFVLVRALVEEDCPVTRAWLIVEALDRLAATGDDGLIAQRRSQYRRELQKLGEPPWKGARRSEYMGAYFSSTEAKVANGRSYWPSFFVSRKVA